MLKTSCQIKTFTIPVNFDDNAVKSKTFLCNNFFHVCLTELLMVKLQRNDDSISDLSSLEYSLTKGYFNCSILIVRSHVPCTKKVTGIEKNNDDILCPWIFKWSQHLENTIFIHLHYE